MEPSRRHQNSYRGKVIAFFEDK